MGIGIDLANENTPEQAQAMENFRDQLLVALITNQAEGGKFELPVADLESTGGVGIAMRIDQHTGTIHFEIKRKH